MEAKACSACFPIELGLVPRDGTTGSSHINHYFKKNAVQTCPQASLRDTSSFEVPFILITVFTDHSGT